VLVTNAPSAARLAPTSPPPPGELPVQLVFRNITNQVQAHTTNPKAIAGGWEFDLDTVVSLKSFKLDPPSALLGAISVRDGVKIKAHVKVLKDPPNS
jgi:hypothetical protein